jgi:threonine efflux protein
MELLQGLLLISSIHLLAAASPGPDFILVSQQTLSHGKKAGLMCSIGLAAIIANSSTTLWIIKVLGGSYLLYLGYQGIRAKASADTNQQMNHKTPIKRSAFKNIGVGFLCNALNPKAPIYFVALFTVVLSPDLPLLHLVIYGLWMMAIQLAWFSSVVLLLSRPKINDKLQRLGHWIDRILGGAMILIGLKILTSRID